MRILKKQKSLLEAICQRIYDKKGFNLLVLDVRGLSTMCDFFIIAEGNVERHVQALLRAVSEQMSEQKRSPYHTEGERTGDWAVLDYGDIIVHFFIPEMREKYAIEQVWRAGSIVDIAPSEMAEKTD